MGEQVVPRFDIVLVGATAMGAPPPIHRGKAYGIAIRDAGLGNSHGGLIIMVKRYLRRKLGVGQISMQACFVSSTSI